jgi:DNA repair exonuclease SbcCD ATPase subunit
MITLGLLKWSNCFSYGPNNEIDLSSSTVTQIIGTNGMGKSSIPLIIEEVLFNKNSKGIKKVDIANRYMKDGYTINLSFTKDADQYEVDVQRKATSKVKLSKNGEDISSHTATNTYKTIQELMGSDFKTFSQLVYQNTNSSLQFLTATNTNRKKFLIDLLHLENYVKLFDVFREASKEIASESTRVTAQIDTIENWLKTNKLSDTNILPMIKVEIETEKDEKLSAKLQEEILNISGKNKKISANNNYSEMLSAIDIDKVQSIKIDALESYDHHQSQLGEEKASSAGSQRLLEKLEKLGDHCPTCEQDVDSSFKASLIEQEQEKLDTAHNAISSLNIEIAAIKANNEKYRWKTKTQRDWEELYRSVDPKLPTATLDKGELEGRLAGVRAQLQTARDSLEVAAGENQKRTKRNTRIQVIQEQTEEFLSQLSESSAILAEKNELLSNLEVLKKSFSTNGLLAYKIENLVEELEELVNTYLAELSDGRFTLEFVVSNDKLNVQITDNENIVDILALSSGELARVNTATLLAIRKLMSSISKSRINILFLDEVIGVLDSAGREKLVEVLLEEDLNTYVVSHGWEHPLLEKLEVIKDGHTSRIE